MAAKYFRNNLIIILWQIIIIWTTVFLQHVDSASYIIAKDLYTVTDTPPFTLTVHYSNIPSGSNLACNTVGNNGLVSSEANPLSVGEYHIIDVEFTADPNSAVSPSFPIEVQCSTVGQTSALETKATISHVGKNIDLCGSDMLYLGLAITKDILIKSGVSTGTGTTTLDCSCNDGNGDPSLEIPQVTKSSDVYEFLLAATSKCDLNICSCTLECDFTGANLAGSSMSRKINVVTTSVLYITSSFDKITQYKNGTITVFTYPIASKDISCFVNKVTITDFNVGEVNYDADFKDIKLLKESNGVFIVFLKDSWSAPSNPGVYGIKCKADDLFKNPESTFVFQFVNSDESKIAGEKPDFGQYVSVLCSCDHTPKFCDSRCCCDPDCTSTQKQSFGGCIAGPSGGDHSTTIKPDCSDISNVSPWERALCIKKSNSAFLGKYNNFVNQSFTSENKWNDANIAGIPSTSPSNGYSIITHSTHFTEGFLTLPGNIGGECVSAQPLRLLENSYVVCKRLVTDNCNLHTGDEFSAHSYLSPTDSVVNPCLWYTSVYSNGSNEYGDAIIKVLYKNDGKTVNNEAFAILRDQSCKHAVTDVEYNVVVVSGKVISITATITVKDLSSQVGKSVITSYRVKYTSPNSSSTTVKTIPPEIGYNKYDPLLIVSGKLKLPQYGDCNGVDTSVPKFGVSTIVQCYIEVPDDAIRQNCSALYNLLVEEYSKFVENGTSIGSTPGNDSPVHVIISNTLKTTGMTEADMCDYLPSYLHIILHHKKNTVSGANITDAAFYLEYGSVPYISGLRFMLYADLQYLISDLPSRECSLCWEDIVEFFQNKQELLNSLIVIFAALVYFAVPKNFMSSRL